MSKNSFATPKSYGQTPHALPGIAGLILHQPERSTVVFFLEMLLYSCFSEKAMAQPLHSIP